MAKTRFLLTSLKGASAVEYGMTVAAIGVAATMVIYNFSDNTKLVLGDASDELVVIGDRPGAAPIVEAPGAPTEANVPPSCEIVPVGGSFYGGSAYDGDATVTALPNNCVYFESGYGMVRLDRPETVPFTVVAAAAVDMLSVTVAKGNRGTIDSASPMSDISVKDTNTKVIIRQNYDDQLPKAGRLIYSDVNDVSTARYEVVLAPLDDSFAYTLYGDFRPGQVLKFFGRDVSVEEAVRDRISYQLENLNASLNDIFGTDGADVFDLRGKSKTGYILRPLGGGDTLLYDGIGTVSWSHNGGVDDHYGGDVIDISALPSSSVVKYDVSRTNENGSIYIRFPNSNHVVITHVEFGLVDEIRFSDVTYTLDELKLVAGY